MAHKFFLSDLKKTLDNCIAEPDEIHFMFCKNPESDFTRNRKLSFPDYIQLMLQMQSKSVSNEISDFFEHSLSAPSKSAFTQQQYKLQPVTDFDFPNENCLYYDIEFRIVRIRLDNGTYICIATNLQRTSSLWMKSKNFIVCDVAKKQAFVNSNIQSDCSTGTVASTMASSGKSMHV